MKHIVLTLAVLIGGMVNISAQITDTNNSNFTIIPAVPDTNGDTNETSFDIKPLSNNGLSNPNTNRMNGMSVPNPSNSNNNSNGQFSMFEKEKYGNPGEKYEKRIREESEKLERKPDESVIGKTTDQFLGDFKTNSSTIKVIYRDYSAVDGDRVRIFVDGEVVRSNVILGGTFTGFVIELIDGFNKIDFQALNQGDSGPNTAEFMVLDAGGNIIVSKYWALATGVKASIILVKE